MTPWCVRGSSTYIEDKPIICDSVDDFKRAPGFHSMLCPHDLHILLNRLVDLVKIFNLSSLNACVSISH